MGQSKSEQETTHALSFGEAFCRNVCYKAIRSVSADNLL